MSKQNKIHTNNQWCGLTVQQRFDAKYEVDQNGCWVWRAGTTPAGYGIFWIDGRYEYAHRASWVLAGHALVDGMQLDHLCRNRPCCNPAHLEQVTPQENQHRSNSVSGINSRKTNCPQGHPYDDENTRVGPDNRRTCRICSREKLRRWRAKQKTQRKEAA